MKSLVTTLLNKNDKERPSALKFTEEAKKKTTTDERKLTGTGKYSFQQ